MPSSPVPQNNLVFSTFFELEKIKIIWKRACYFQLFKISWLLPKKINVIFSLLELRNFFKKRLCPAIFDSFERNFPCALKKSRTYTRFQKPINVFLYAIRSRVLVLICDDYAIRSRVLVLICDDYANPRRSC